METVKKYFPWVLCVVMAMLWLSCAQEWVRERGRANDNLAAAMDLTRYYKNRLDGETATVKTLQLDKNQLRALVIQKDARINALTKEFANVKTVVQWRGGVRVDSIPVPFAVPVPCDFTRTDTVATKHYSFAYRVNQDGLRVDNIAFPDTVTVITGTKRKWFLGKETLTTDVTHSNPHVKANGITAAELVVVQPWYKKWYVWLAAGAVAGALIK